MIGESHEKLPATGDVSRGQNIIRWGHKFLEETEEQPAKWVFQYALVPSGRKLKDKLRERPTMPDAKVVEAALTAVGCKEAAILSLEADVVVKA